MYQRVVIVGNLGRDPELRYTSSGAPVASFPVATNRKWTDTDGTNHEETTWFRVSVWGRQAEICNQYIEKGRLVLIDGEIRTGQYDDQQGVTRYTWELRAGNVKFLGGPGDRAATPAFDGHMLHDEAPQAGAGKGTAAAPMRADMAEEDIPF